MAYSIQFLETPQYCFCIKKPTYLSIYYNYKESSMLWKLEKGIYSSIYRSQQKGRAHHIKLGRTILHSRPSSCLLCALQLNCTCTVIVFCRFQYNFMQNTIEMMFDTTQIRSKKFRYAEIPKLVSNLQESRSKQLKFFREATWSLWLGKIIFLRATKTNPTYPISILPTYKVKLEDWVFSEPFNEIKKVRQYLMQNRPTTFFSVILYSSYSFTHFIWWWKHFYRVKFYKVKVLICPTEKDSCWFFFVLSSFMYPRYQMIIGHILDIFVCSWDWTDQSM